MFLNLAPSEFTALLASGKVIRMLALILSSLLATPDLNAQICPCNEFVGSSMKTGGNNSWYWKMYREGAGDLNESLIFSRKRNVNDSEVIGMSLSKDGELNLKSIKAGNFSDWYWRMYREGAGELNESLVFATKRHANESEVIGMSLSKDGLLNLKAIQTGGVSTYYWKNIQTR